MPNRWRSAEITERISRSSRHGTSFNGVCTMSTSIAPAPANQPTVTVVLEALKSRQHAAWSSGDYAIVGRTLQIVGEQLCEALDVRSGQRVLDVAAGNGNVTLAAARRWCDVVSTDYVPELLERGRARAQAEGLSVELTRMPKLCPLQTIHSIWSFRPSGSCSRQTPKKRPQSW